MDDIAAAGEIDPEILSRWMVISSLIVGAEELLLRASGAWPRMALVMADTASEAILGLLGAGAPNAPGDHARWEDALAAAVTQTASTGGIPIPLRSRLRETHRARNLAIHHGTDSGSSTPQRALGAARELRSIAIAQSQLLAAFAMSGPVRAVAKLVDRPALSRPLLVAADALDSADVRTAADAAAAALDRALRLVDPPLRADYQPHNFDLRRDPRTRDPGVLEAVRNLRRGIQSEAKAADQRAKRQEAWIVALGLGLSPRQLAGLRRTLGEYVSWDMNRETRQWSWSVHRTEGEEFDARAVEAATETVADVVFRLWATDSLRRPDGNMILD